VHNLFDEASCYNDLGNNNCHLRRSQNSHNATYDYEKFYSRGFSATGEEVDGEQKQGDVDAYDPSQLAARHDVVHNVP
jgi:hypothetical protein